MESTSFFASQTDDGGLDRLPVQYNNMHMHLVTKVMLRALLTQTLSIESIYRRLYHKEL
jgi:hypothetical protein